MPCAGSQICSSRLRTRSEGNQPELDSYEKEEAPQIAVGPGRDGCCVSCAYSGGRGERTPMPPRPGELSLVVRFVPFGHDGANFVETCLYPTEHAWPCKPPPATAVGTRGEGRSCPCHLEDVLRAWCFLVFSNYVHAQWGWVTCLWSRC